MIALVHAFSRRNAGDSLLVDLAQERLERAGIPREECCVFALDAHSFGDLPCVERVPGEPWGRVSRDLLPALGELLGSTVSRLTGMRLSLGHLARSLGRAEAFVAVGGGYLRTPTLVNSLGVLVNHLPQLTVVSGSDRPSIYLPQSIGPLSGLVGAATLRLLGNVDKLYVRDDESLRAVGDGTEVERLPDLAVLEIARAGPAPRSTAGAPRALLVGRSLRSGKSYEERLSELAAALHPVEWPVQATGLGGRSDADFYRRLDVQPSAPLHDALASGHGVVISVRLHGALQAILRGWPAIHLAYSRKGWGGFKDLGLQEFVHPAHGFSPSTVARQARGLMDDAGMYWRRIESRVDGLRAAGRELQERLEGLAALVASARR